MSDMDELRQRLVSIAGAMGHAAESASLRGEWTAEIDLNALERWGKTLSAGAALLAQGQAPPLAHAIVAVLRQRTEAALDSLSDEQRQTVDERAAGLVAEMRHLSIIETTDTDAAHLLARDHLAQFVEARGQAPVATGVDRERVNEVSAEMSDAALAGAPVPAETVRMWAHQLKEAAAQGQASPQGVVTLQAPVKVRVIGSQPDQPYEVDVTEDPNGLIVRESAGGGARLITVHQSGNVSEEAPTPPGVMVEPLLRYAQAQAKCPCCGQSVECTPECTLADDDIEAWSAVDNARSVVAAALGAGKGDAGC